MTRLLFVDPDALRPTSEEWPRDLLDLWQTCGVSKQREALAYRMQLRAAANPEDDRAWPAPACPVLWHIRLLELRYRKASYCRGGRQGWE